MNQKCVVRWNQIWRRCMEMTKTVVIRLECEEKPTVNDVLEYIEQLGEYLQFEIEGEDDEVEKGEYNGA